MKKRIWLAIGLLLLAVPVLAEDVRKPCEELKSEIAAKLDAKGVVNYALTAVKNEEVKEGDKVVGSCDGGTMKIVYVRQ